jgi:hypothetical protein
LHAAWTTLRYGRDGYCFESKSYADTDTETVTDTDTDTDTDRYGRANADSHPDRHNQCGDERRKLFRYTQWLSQSAWNHHDGLLSVWPDDQLRLHHPDADSDWQHGPAH